jgi:hypothetical protein
MERSSWSVLTITLLFSKVKLLTYSIVLSPTEVLTHEEHQLIAIPKGDWMVRIQREYEPEGWRYVAD